MKVLFLSLWYPNKFDAMAGLFVKKHAEAISLFANVDVLYIHASKETRYYSIEDKYLNDNFHEKIVYYPFTKNKILKVVRFIKAYRIGLKQLYLYKNERPDIIHSNILTRHAVMAYILHLQYKIPYVVMEHWSRYLPENFGYSNVVRKLFTNFVVKRAQALLTVSTLLFKALQAQKIINKNSLIVNNVVDDDYFNDRLKAHINKEVRILNVSCFDEKSKNINLLLKACVRLKNNNIAFKLVLVGTGNDFEYIQNKIIEYDLSLNVEMTGELAPTSVKDEMHKSDFYVCSSNYETAGVVLSEALASGLPIVSTEVGIAPDIVSEDVGILVKTQNLDELSFAMEKMCYNYWKYDATDISLKAKEFSYKAVGSKLFSIYKKSILKT